ncbi:MAG: hypothetical protein HZA90_11755 [Verrucomicrobia bacterium]|nr:hypothetical protein [Verrucomicrobiota bacterium]
MSPHTHSHFNVPQVENLRHGSQLQNPVAASRQSAAMLGFRAKERGALPRRRYAEQILAAAALLLLPFHFATAAPALPSFDFTQPAVCAEWRAQHHLSGFHHTPDGLEMTIEGMDPYFAGPPRDYPAGTPLWLIMRVKSETGGAAQVFHFRDHPTEENSARCGIKAGDWREVRMMLPALGPGHRLRLDPPGTRGKFVLASLTFAPAVALTAPEWPKPVPADFRKAARLRSGPVELLVAERGFAVNVDGQRVAASHTRPLIGYTVGERMRWLDLTSPGLEPTRVEQVPGRATTTATLGDQDGAKWKITQQFTANATPGVIDLRVTVEVDRDRDVAFLPLLLLIAGGEANITAKGQALFAGLEYLDNEPSSSEADLIGPESKRQVPANHKITIPLMVVQHAGRYVGLIWDHAPPFSALFDSPDRVLSTGGHVMGVLFPGSDTFNRREGSLMPMRTEPLRAGQPLTLQAQLLGGAGASVVPALQQYVKVRGLPPTPETGNSFQDYVSLAAHGWLDSKARETNLFRHAVWPGFGPHPAADAALHLNWLAGQTADVPLRQRLLEVEKLALAAVPPRQWDISCVGHVRYPVQSLVFGHVSEIAEQHRAHARASLSRFNLDGTVTYRAHDKTDYGRTHFTNHANGLTAQVAASALEAAVFSGDRALIDQALAELRLLQRAYAHGVPRGAQTWEVPLHTPDILASAHLVHAFTMGWQLTGERALLDEAVYWAWTGLPFLYLINPVGFPDPPYGCVTVYGATSWKAPVWFGRPVQWCGLVYADALYRLTPHDPAGPWRQLADGITAMGVRYTWPRDDQERQGLLPDVWEMQQQERAGPAINPATVQVNAVRLYRKAGLYDFRVFRANGRRLTVHAPGEIMSQAENSPQPRFSVRGWPTGPYFVLVNGLSKAPQVKIDGQAAPLNAPHEFEEKAGRLILKLSGQPTVELGLDP